MRAPDTRSIEEICSSTWESLYRFVYYKVQNREEAEDITQETYAKAYSHMKKGKVQPDKYNAFLRTVAQNVMRDLWRKKKRRGTPVNIEAVNPAQFAGEDPTVRSDEREMIQNALTLLTQEQQQVIDLRILKGYSVADTAKRMNKQEPAVRVIQHRALKLLSRILEDNP